MTKRSAVTAVSALLTAAVLFCVAVLIACAPQKTEDNSNAQSSEASEDVYSAAGITASPESSAEEVTDSVQSTAAASDTSLQTDGTATDAAGGESGVTTEPELTGYAADETSKPAETSEAGVTTKKPEQTTSAPEVTDAPEHTTSVPVVTEKPEDTTSLSPDTTSGPAQTTTPGEATLKPAETASPEESTVKTSETSSPAGTTSGPEQTASPEESTVRPAETSSPAETTSVPSETSAPETEPVTPDAGFTVTYVSGTANAWSYSAGVLSFGKISENSVYAISGVLDGCIVIDAGEDYKLELDLCGFTLNSASESPVTVISADEFELSAQKGTENFINDTRAAVTEESDYTAAVWADCDMTLKGKGALTVLSENNNGIHCKNDLTVKNLTLAVTCTDDALKGKSSVTVESGTLTLIATGGDCIKTSSSEISSKGNQKGTVAIKGGTVNVYAACDGISGAYNVEISGDGTVLNINTDKYSDYTGTVKTSSSSKMYLRLSSAVYSMSYRYAVMFYNDTDDYVWKDVTYYGKQSSMGFRSAVYYLYTFEKPSGYANMKIFGFSQSQTSNSATDYSACTSGGTVNADRNMYAITSASSSKLTGGWSNYSSSGSGSGQSGSSYSTKGIKAENEIIISGGNVTVKSNDDALHATGYEALENNAQGTGNIYVDGGTLTLTSLDDAMHADGKLVISGGNISVVTAYEGLEGNGIEISGGEINVYATDDGLNAAGSGFTPYITVSGGSLTVLVGSGDTDGIDSNGSYTQTGGFVFTRSKTNDTSGNASGLDLDGTCRVTGGTLVVAGNTSASPASGSVCVVRFGSSSGGGRMGRPGSGYGSGSSVSFAAGTWSVKDSSGNLICSFVLDSACSGMMIASESFTAGSTYTLTNGTVTKTWTQSSSSVTVSQ